MITERNIIAYQRENVSQYRAQIEAFEKEYPYAYWITLDFKDETDVAEGIHKANGWVIHNSKRRGAHLLPWLVYEPEFTRKRLSLHEILRSDVEIPIKRLRSSWRWGDCPKVEIYDHSRRGVEYCYEWHIAAPATLFCSGKNSCRKNRGGNILCSHPAKNKVVGLV